jgi:divalent metal cation (Fe/Co/Zn/Cd) transporter
LEKKKKQRSFPPLLFFALGILKGIASFASGSVALLAGTIDSFSDVFSSVAVWAGLNIAKRKPTERFPYGYYKVVTFALFTVSLVIVHTAL